MIVFVFNRCGFRYSHGNAGSVYGSGAGNIWAVLLSVSRPSWRADGGDRKACATPANCTQERHHTHASCPHSKYTVFIRQHIMPVMQHWEVVYFKHMELRCQVKVGTGKRFCLRLYYIAVELPMPYLLLVVAMPIMKWSSFIIVSTYREGCSKVSHFCLEFYLYY